MPLARQSDQMIGADLQQILTANAVFGTGTYHIAFFPFAGNSQNTGLKSGAPNAQDVLYSGGKFLDLIIDITNANGGSLTATIFGIDAASGKVFPTAGIITSAALAANATTVLKVGPGLTPAANLVVNDFMPLVWNIQIVIATAAMTLSVGAHFMP